VGIVSVVLVGRVGGGVVRRVGVVVGAESAVDLGFRSDDARRRAW